MSLSSLPPEIRHLPIPIRVQLADQLWESVFEDEAGFNLTDAQKLELDRRLQLADSAADMESSWEVVKRRILNR